MFLTDDHIHTHFSSDGQARTEDICENALAQGLSEIAITDHMDIFTDKPYGDILDCEAWYEELLTIREKYRGKLLVHLGIELGQPQCNPGEARAFLEKYPLDFVLGSVHNMENDMDVFYYDFTKVDYRQVCPHYVDWLKVMARDYDFDIMGHVTYPARYVFEKTGVSVNMMDYCDSYEELFKILIARGKGIELNLSGIARNRGDIMPTMELLKLYRRCGGELITLGSDAHVAGQVGSVSRKGQELLLEAGFEYVTWFEERRPHFEKLG